MMTIKMYHYPKCSTCRKAQKWLSDHEVAYEAIDVVNAPPTAAQIEQWHKDSGEALKRFFNTSGQKYRALDLKNKLADMSEQEQYALLASDGMLLKRPLVTDGNQVTLGFKEDVYENTWLAKEK